MKVCIVGSGAIGGFIGARLAAAGASEVCAIEVGPALAAMREHGWRLHQDGKLIQLPARVSDRATDFGPQDLVVVAVKGQVLPLVAPTVAALCGQNTVVLPSMNGVPWWFGHGTELGDEPLQSVDPEGRIAQSIPFDRVLGCVVHASSSAPEPGVVRHIMGKGLVIGEASGGKSERSDHIGALLSQAGFDVKVTTNVRYEVWYKLWGNLTMNPVSAMTGATIDRLLDDPLVRGFCSNAMCEAAAIGERLGCAISQSPEDRHALTAKLGAFKTSMLQDAEAGRQLELDGIVTSVHEMGVRLGVPTPNIDALLGLARLFGRVHSLYPEAKP